LSNYVEVDRPSWIDYFLGLAFCVAERSEDAETHHGCILTTPNNHIIGTGYNSLPRGISKGLLPNTRKEEKKYLHIIHAEINSLFNKVLDPWLIPEGCIAYVTAKPCLKCLYSLWNNNVRTVYYAETGYHFQGHESETEYFYKFVEDVGMKINVVEPKLEWLLKPIKRLKSNS
jgi:dCMP deaminase